MRYQLSIPTVSISDEPKLLDFMRALEFMCNRMAVSHHKYGQMEHKYPDNAKAIDSAMERIKLYNKTGNTEHLLDAANFLVIEHVLPSHKKAHFRATDSHESPGIKYREDE